MDFNIDKLLRAKANKLNADARASLAKSGADKRTTTTGNTFAGPDELDIERERGNQARQLQGLRNSGAMNIQGSQNQNSLALADRDAELRSGLQQGKFRQQDSMFDRESARQFNDASRQRGWQNEDAERNAMMEQWKATMPDKDWTAFQRMTPEEQERYLKYRQASSGNIPVGSFDKD